MPARNLVSFKPSVARAPAALASFVLCFPGVSCLPCSRQFPWVLPPSGGGSGSRDPWPGGSQPGSGGRSWTPASGSASGSSAETRNVRPKHPQETDRLPARRLPRGCMRQIAAGCFKENIWAARFSEPLRGRSAQSTKRPRLKVRAEGIAKRRARQARTLLFIFCELRRWHGAGSPASGAHLPLAFCTFSRPCCTSCGLGPSPGEE